MVLFLGIVGEDGWFQCVEQGKNGVIRYGDCILDPDKREKIKTEVDADRAIISEIVWILLKASTFELPQLV